MFKFVFLLVLLLIIITVFIYLIFKISIPIYKKTFVYQDNGKFYLNNIFKSEEKNIPIILSSKNTFYQYTFDIVKIVNNKTQIILNQEPKIFFDFQKGVESSVFVYYTNLFDIFTK